MIFNRTIVFSPAEPAPLSLKLTSGLDMTLRLQYLSRLGTPQNTDFAAQLYLISRTTRKVQMYPLAATDVVNGKAQAFIPAGDINDPNGYNLQIIGTSGGEPRLIAKGSASVFMTEALGIIPADIIDSVDITFAYNEPASFDVTLWKDTNKTVPYDLTASTVIARTYVSLGGVALVPFTVELIAINKVRLTMTEDQVNSLPPSCWWDLSVTSGGGLTTLAQGDVLVTGTVEPPFATLVTTYAYDKPTALTAPISGAVQHCSNALDILRVSVFDKAAVDQSATLSRLVDGDHIAVGTTTWTIVSTDFVDTGSYYQFVVTPATADAVTGDQAFTFTKA